MKLDHDSRLLISTAIIIVSAIVVSWIAMGQAQHAILKQEATTTAVRWAQFLQRNLTGLNHMLAAGLVNDADRATFDFALATGTVTHYQILKADGTVAYSSWLGDFQTSNTRSDVAQAIAKREIFAGLRERDVPAGHKAVIGEAVVPLRDDSGQTGAVKVEVDLTERARDLEHIRMSAFAALFVLLLLMSTGCGLLIWRNISNRRWAETLQKSRGHVLERLATGASLAEVLTTLIDSVEKLKTGTSCSIALPASEAGGTEPIVAPSLPPSYRDALWSAQTVLHGGGAGGSGTAATYHRFDDPNLDASEHRLRDLALAAGIHATWSQPFVSSHGKLLGVLTIHYREVDQPSQSDLDFFRAVTHLASIAIEHHDAQSKVSYLAHNDALTGLPNRREFEGRLTRHIEQAKISGGNFAVAVLDIDKFKSINDTYGHPVGDIVITETARRIASCIRSDDVVARLGGDEFAIIFHDTGAGKELADIAERIIEQMRQPMEAMGKTITTSTSIGISYFPRHATDAEDLFVKADHALYQAKQKGRQLWEMYDEELHESIRERQVLERDLRAALGRDEFSLVYQPKVDLRTGAMMGLEALARWRHPTLGLVSPSTFIPVAEASTLIMEIGEKLLYRACSQAMNWKSAGLTDIRVAVNVAARQFRDPEFPEKVRRVLSDTGLDPKCLELEITETMLIDDLARVGAVLADLRDRGVLISIDDFGTGYSSLLYLARFPFQSIKIDQSFVKELPADPDCVTIVTSILAMARRMNLAVVAEGVETAEQASFLRTHGCAMGQGYLFSKPMEPHLVMPWYRTQLREIVERALPETQGGRKASA